MQLEKRPHQNFKGTLNHPSQLKRNPEPPTTTLQVPYAVTRKEPLMKSRGAAQQNWRRFPTKIREVPSGTLHLERRLSGTNRDETPEITQDETLTTRVEP